jgi:hypothetical protein
MKRLGSIRHSEQSTDSTNGLEFRWERRAQGPINLPDLHRRVIATQVLIYLICKSCIDDVLIDGADEVTFVNNVRQVFSQFRKLKIVVNPKKTELGLEEVEYVGHFLSLKGISFTKEKRKKMMNFERPRTHKEMLMYVGLVNVRNMVEHDHVRNMNDLLRPLRKMVERYDKHKRLEWTPELITIYEEIRRIIADCQQLFFKPMLPTLESEAIE